MSPDTTYEDLDPTAAEIIRRKASRLVGRVGFTEPDREDHLAVNATDGHVVEAAADGVQPDLAVGLHQRCGHFESPLWSELPELLLWSCDDVPLLSLLSDERLLPLLSDERLLSLS